MVQTERLITAEELLYLPDEGKRRELLDGVIVEMAPPGGEHGYTVTNVVGPLHAHVLKEGLGAVLTGDVGFILKRDPDRVRAPDIAFVSRAQLSKTGLPKGFLEGCPDLAVEVISPGDSAAEVQAKVEEWLAAGCQAVWAVYPSLQRVLVHLPSKPIQTLGPNDTLRGEPAVPGFACRVSELFPPLFEQSE